MTNRRTVYEARGLRFHFLIGAGPEPEPRITARWGVLPAQAIHTFFSGVTWFDEEHGWFVTATPDFELLWTWLVDDREVFAAACQRLAPVSANGHLGEALESGLASEEAAPDAKLEALAAAAEQALAEPRLSVTWKKPYLDAAKRAAALMGVAFPTYLKEAIYRQACADLDMAQSSAPEIGAGSRAALKRLVLGQRGGRDGGG